MSLASRLSTGVLLLGIGSLALVARLAQADVLFSSLPFSGGGGREISGASSFNSYFEAAAQFTPLETATLDSIQIPLSSQSNARRTMTISIFTSVDNLPGVSVASQIIPANTITFPGSLYTVNFGGTPLLTAGTSYFVDAATVGDTIYGWNLSLSSLGLSAPYRTDPTGVFNADTLPMAFQVNGTPVSSTPEPGSIALLAGLGIAIGVCFNHRHPRRVIG